MFACCLPCLYRPRPEPINVVEEVKASSPFENIVSVQKWYQGSYSTGSFTYEKIKTIQKTGSSQIDKISFQGKELVLKSAKNKSGSRGIDREVSILTILNAAEKEKSQKCVIDLIARVTTGDKPGILLPFFPSDLFDRLKKENGLPLESTVKILYQMLKILAFLKGRQIFHRDIKPENILILNGDEIRLADFGMAVEKRDFNESKRLCGTGTFQSPERIMVGVYGSLWDKPFDFPSDMWATAYTVFITATSRPLFIYDTEDPEWVQRLMMEQMKLPQSLEQQMPTIYTAKSDQESLTITAFQTVLRQMFDRDPSVRLTPEKGIDFLEKRVIYLK